jgi:hypothetical protein
MIVIVTAAVYVVISRETACQTSVHVILVRRNAVEESCRVAALVSPRDGKPDLAAYCGCVAASTSLGMTEVVATWNFGVYLFAGE